MLERKYKAEWNEEMKQFCALDATWEQKMKASATLYASMQVCM